MANYGSHTIFAALTGILVVNYGIRSPFFILGIMPFFGFLIVWKYMKEPRDIANSEEKKSMNHTHLGAKEVGKFIASLLRSPKMLSIFYAGLLTKFVDDGMLTMLLPLWAKSQGFSVIEVAGIATLAHGSFAVSVAITG